MDAQDGSPTASRTGAARQGKKYSDNQAEHMAQEADVLEKFDRWTDDFAALVAAKGKVPPGQHRAFGYEPPGHLLKDLKLKWRETMIGLGRPPADSSPARQQELGLNQDATLAPKKSEGEKLREE